jgi:hypothetical protein
MSCSPGCGVCMSVCNVSFRALSEPGEPLGQHVASCFYRAVFEKADCGRSPMLACRSGPGCGHGLLVMWPLVRDAATGGSNKKRWTCRGWLAARL